METHYNLTTVALQSHCKQYVNLYAVSGRLLKILKHHHTQGLFADHMRRQYHWANRRVFAQWYWLRKKYHMRRHYHWATTPQVAQWYCLRIWLVLKSSNMARSFFSLQIIDDGFIKQGEFCLRADLKADINIVEVEGAGASDLDDNSYYVPTSHYNFTTTTLQIYYNVTTLTSNPLQCSGSHCNSLQLNSTHAVQCAAQYSHPCQQFNGSG